MSDHTLIPLPDPPCGATTPGGDMCPADSAVVVTAEWTTGYSMAVWRCPGHIGASVEACLRYSNDAVVTVTPLTMLAQQAEPTPEPPPPGERPLRLIR
jgi:hypothetical protein